LCGFGSLQGKFGDILFSIQVFKKEKAAKAILVQKPPQISKGGEGIWSQNATMNLWLQKVKLCFFSKIWKIVSFTHL
jgi:hypothetical protein